MAGKPLDHAYKTENLELLTRGCCNLEKHIENARLYGTNVRQGGGCRCLPCVPAFGPACLSVCLQRCPPAYRVG